MILENVLMENEIVQHLHFKTKGGVGEVALKIDLSKAYDKISWMYACFLMLKMGFSPRWVAQININVY